MRFSVLTLFPGMFPGIIDSSILGRARESGKVAFDVHDIREYAEGRHKVTDEPPYGGGAGMVMKPEPIDACLCSVLGVAGPGERRRDGARIILMSPQGNAFTQEKAMELTASCDHVVLVCGHYEGIDERIRRLWVDEEVSIGDYVLTGGELPAMVVMDACARMVPGVLGDGDSALYDSFMNGILDHPHYTRPPSFRGLTVPEVLTSGHHGKIRKWRRMQALVKTREIRPDLFSRIELGDEDTDLLREADGLPPIDRRKKRRRKNIPTPVEG